MKKLCSFILVLVLCFSLFGCGAKQKTIDIAALADELAASECFTDDINALEDSAVSITYVLAEGVKAKVYMSSGAYVDEVSVFEAPDSDTAKTQLEYIKQRLNDRIDNYESYMPDEVPKLNDAIIRQEGNYIVFCVTANTSKANEIIDKYFK